MADLYDEEDDSGQWVNVHTPYGEVAMTPGRARRYGEEVDAAYEARQAPVPPAAPDDSGQWTGVTTAGGKVYMTPDRARRYGEQVDAEYAAQRAEDDALAELAGAMDTAGIGRAPAATAPPVATMARAPVRRRAPPASDTPEDLDALQAEMEDFRNRANAVDVQNVPSTVPLASRLGGEPLPRPGARSAVASPEPSPEQGPTFGESDTLADAQRRAGLMRNIAGIARGTSRVGAAIAGVRPEESGAAAGLEQSADSQVREYLQRRQQSEAEKASAEQAALQDPTSPASQRFQAMVSRAFGSVYTPEQISQMTAADAPLVGKYGEMVRTLDDRAATRAAAQQSEQAQLTARATEAEKQRVFEGKQAAANRANAREIAGMRQEVAGDKADEAFQRKLAERNVSGYAFDPARPPSAEGAKNMAAAVKAQSEILGSLNRLESDIQQHGSEMFGAKAGEMASEWMNVTNKLRMLNDMGVPNGADYLMLAKQITDPTSGAAATTSNARLLQQIASLRSQVGRTVDATANAYGFRPAGGAPAASGTPTAGAAPRRKRDAEGRVWEEQPDGSARLVL